MFLETYLDEFPDTAPIQEFMTLVLNGLSKNSFLSISKKHDIIAWYKAYFKENSSLINEALAAEMAEQAYHMNLAAQKLRITLEKTEETNHN